MLLHQGLQASSAAEASKQSSILILNVKYNSVLLGFINTVSIREGSKMETLMP